jgi:catechol 2,3-dioxygenase-like lactoylglutathione lyase family enzyme
MKSGPCFKKERSVKKIIWILSIVMLCPLASSWAQLLAPNDAGVTMGQLHLIVRDVDANKKFWMLLGGTPVKVDGTEVMKFPGVLVFLTPGTPSGNNKGTVIDHPGFQYPNGDEIMAKLKAAGLKLEPNTNAGNARGYVFSPDDLRVEIINNSSLTVPVSSHHLHYTLPQASWSEMQAWYVKMFGAVPGSGPQNTPAADLPGTSVRFSRSTDTPLPLKGQAMDYIGFEVKNLEAFCKKLETSGVKFDKPYSKSRHPGFASAQLTDPWGTSIELTEGLNHF